MSTLTGSTELLGSCKIFYHELTKMSKYKSCVYVHIHMYVYYIHVYVCMYTIYIHMYVYMNEGRLTVTHNAQLHT